MEPVLLTLQRILPLQKFNFTHTLLTLHMAANTTRAHCQRTVIVLLLLCKFPSAKAGVSNHLRGSAVLGIDVCHAFPRKTIMPCQCIPTLSNNEHNQNSIDFLCTAANAVRMLPSSAFLVFEFPRPGPLEVSPSPAEGSAHAISVTIEYQVRFTLCALITGDLLVLPTQLLTVTVP